VSQDEKVTDKDQKPPEGNKRVSVQAATSSAVLHQPPERLVVIDDRPPPGTRKPPYDQA